MKPLSFIAVPPDQQRIALQSMQRELRPFSGNEDAPLETLKLSGKALAALNAAGIHLIRDLRRYSEEEIARLDGIGPKTLDKLRQYLRPE
jgi:DNA-directed RNA polymerase alpha subunit